MIPFSFSFRGGGGGRGEVEIVFVRFLKGVEGFGGRSFLLIDEEIVSTLLFAGAFS